eukprot:6202273-Pleurochrysis_carterae.AAC.4
MFTLALAARVQVKHVSILFLQLRRSQGRDVHRLRRVRDACGDEVFDCHNGCVLRALGCTTNAESRALLIAAKAREAVASSLPSSIVSTAVESALRRFAVVAALRRVTFVSQGGCAVSLATRAFALAVAFATFAVPVWAVTVPATSVTFCPRRGGDILFHAARWVASAFAVTLLVALAVALLVLAFALVVRR